jgi:hypothetical protein
MHLGPAEVLVAVTIDFRDDLPGGAVEQAAAELTRRIEAAHPEVTRIFLRPRPQQMSAARARSVFRPARSAPA